MTRCERKGCVSKATHDVTYDDRDGTRLWARRMCLACLGFTRERYKGVRGTLTDRVIDKGLDNKMVKK